MYSDKFSRLCGKRRFAMFVIVKWIAVALFTGFAWLVTGYTIEYFRPYKKIDIRPKKKD
jgi:apolipoprotein N-acyltransferase